MTTSRSLVDRVGFGLAEANVTPKQAAGGAVAVGLLGKLGWPFAKVASSVRVRVEWLLVKD